MKWFGINITNTVSATKMALVTFAFASGSLVTMSFTNREALGISHAMGDTIVNDKSGFRNLSAERSLFDNNTALMQLNPRVISFVQDFVRKQGKEMERMKSWGKPYLDLYDNILTEYGIPKEMKYLSVIESDLQPGLVSWAGAVGPWQLMDYEAKRFGLRVGRGIDERTNFYKSTQVAAKLMKELYTEFGDWLLVIAAYNGGSGRVRQAIRKSGSHDFWTLQPYLREETRNHVKKFISTHYIFEGSGGLTTMSAAETKAYLANFASTQKADLSEAELANTAVTEVSGRYNSLIVCNWLLMDITEFNKFNPGFDKALAEGQRYPMRLSKERVFVFEARKNEILLQSIRSLLEGSATSK